LLLKASFNNYNHDKLRTTQVYRLICHGSVEDQMLDRIRRKLFLSLKIMGSDQVNSNENSSLGSNELLDILRRGSSALSRSDDGMELAHFLGADISEILQMSRSLDQSRETKMKSELSSCPLKTEESLSLAHAEEEEKRLLSGVAQVHSRLFEGKIVQKQSNSEIAREWRDIQKRARADRTVTVGGLSFIVTPETEAVSGVHSLH
jgi:SWI/SNF-related matrix-associated actin-dependent regulator of chromatin subfamily A member 5